MNRHGCRIVSALTLSSVLAAAPLSAQRGTAPSGAVAIVASLVAYPDSTRESVPRLGDGIIVGYDLANVYLVTARHVAEYAKDGGELVASFAFMPFDTVDSRPVPRDTVAARVARLHPVPGLDPGLVTVVRWRSMAGTSGSRSARDFAGPAVSRHAAPPTAGDATTSRESDWRATRMISPLLPFDGCARMILRQTDLR